MAREIETKCIHLEEKEDSTHHYGAMTYPIYQTATYAHPGVGQSTVDISHILGNLITVIFDYQILRKPLKILSL